MNEAAFQQMVTDLCDWYRLRWTHFRPAKTEKGWRTAVSGSKGWLDLVIVGPGGCIFVELKSQTGKVTHDQQVWIDMLTAAGEQVYVWRPSDWPRVMDTLKGLSKRPLA